MFMVVAQLVKISTHTAARIEAIQATTMIGVVTEYGTIPLTAGLSRTMRKFLSHKFMRLRFPVTTTRIVGLSILFMVVTRMLSTVNQAGQDKINRGELFCVSLWFA
jgi:hypothetical protein